MGTGEKIEMLQEENNNLQDAVDKLVAEKIEMETKILELEATIQNYESEIDREELRRAAERWRANCLAIGDGSLAFYNLWRKAVEQSDALEEKLAQYDAEIDKADDGTDEEAFWNDDLHELTTDERLNEWVGFILERIKALETAFAEHESRKCEHATGGDSIDWAAYARRLEGTYEELPG